MASPPHLTAEDIAPLLLSALPGHSVSETTEIQTAILTRELKAFVVDQDKLTEDRVMARLTRMLLAQLLVVAAPVAYGIWLLSGIYTTGAQSLDLVRNQQTELAARGRWMQERERWEDSVEIWAGPKGYVPPRYRAGKVE